MNNHREERGGDAGQNLARRPIAAIADELVERLADWPATPPVTHVYNPLAYARAGYDAYMNRFGTGVKQVVLVGMNPGPFGMAQTGVPFGDVAMVTTWMGIREAIRLPAEIHPKRPIMGFDCPRKEVSGRRLWGWAKERFGPPDNFFDRFFVLNYCPLVFMEAGGRNRTPDKLSVAQKQRLFEICDRALRQSVEVYRPRWVIGVGQFAESRAAAALTGLSVKVGRISHPSPANPRANRGWAALIESELAAMGIEIP